jgi:hypothetical protein
VRPETPKQAAAKALAKNTRTFFIKTPKIKETKRCAFAAQNCYKCRKKNILAAKRKSNITKSKKTASRL